jgi:serine/threonine protein kinase
MITYGLNGRFIKLADFGLATNHEYEEQSHSQGRGTSQFMAPKVRESEKYDIRADIHSFSVILKIIFEE